MQSSCPGCSSAALRPWIEVRGFQYVTCGGCSLATLRPDQVAAPDRLYTADYFERGAQSGYTDYAADEPVHRLNARRHLVRLERSGIRPPGTLLDVGCAAGFFMHEASIRGWTVSGVDVSPWSRDYARKRFGFTIFSSIEEARAAVPGGFDAVTAFQVLEHLPDVHGALRSLRLALKPGGALCVETWDRGSRAARLAGTGWQQLSPPSVVHLFDRSSLNDLLHDSGFARARLRPMSKFLSVAWAAGLVGSKLGSGWITRIAASALLRRVPLPYFLDDLVYLTTHRRNRAAQEPPRRKRDRRKGA
jgi:SAM-dependent methyltransferase